MPLNLQDPETVQQKLLPFHETSWIEFSFEENTFEVEEGRGLSAKVFAYNWLERIWGALFRSTEEKAGNRTSITNLRSAIQKSASFLSPTTQQLLTQRFATGQPISVGRFREIVNEIKIRQSAVAQQIGAETGPSIIGENNLINIIETAPSNKIVNKIDSLPKTTSVPRGLKTEKKPPTIEDIPTKAIVKDESGQDAVAQQIGAETGPSISGENNIIIETVPPDPGVLKTEKNPPKFEDIQTKEKVKHDLPALEEDELPPLSSIVTPTLEECFHQVTNGLVNMEVTHNRQLVGFYGDGILFKYRPEGKEPFFLKTIREGTAFPIEEEKDFHQLEATSIYLQGKNGQKIPGVLRYSAYYLECYNSSSDQQSYHYILLQHPKQVKEYLRQLLNSGNIIKIVAIEMPYVEGMALNQEGTAERLRKNISQRRSIAQQLMAMLQGLHKQGIIDRDIKPASFLYNNRDESLTKIDNGLMVKFSKQGTKQTEKKTEYYNLTYVSTRAVEENEGPWLDLYSAALILLEMRYHPDMLSATHARFQRNLEGRVSLEEAKEFTEYRNLNVNKSYLECLLTFSYAQTKDTTARDQLQQAIRDLKAGNVEMGFIEAMLQVSMTVQPCGDSDGGRETLYADYYRQLEELIQNRWLE